MMTTESGKTSGSGKTLLASRSVVLASADAELRERLRASLAGMRWKVCVAEGGAEAMAHVEEHRPEALLVDHWLPDLEVEEFAGHVLAMFPDIDLLRLDGDVLGSAPRSPRRHELLHAMREAQEGPRSDTAVWQAARVAVPRGRVAPVAASTAGASLPELAGLPILEPETARREVARAVDASLGDGALVSGEPSPGWISDGLHAAADVEAAVQTEVAAESDQTAFGFAAGALSQRGQLSSPGQAFSPAQPIQGLLGTSPAMLELTHMIRLVAPRSTTVLIQGETGSGKEVVAKALHMLSGRAQKPFMVLNCAAIPEALLEAELFGHTRGAFTGAVTSRTGRIEAAHGGTLFLDEIGEMPLPLQAKMLRFLESGELQRVGDNEVMRVDTRVIAATHRDLETNSADGSFRLDLFHRLAVFPVDVPALRERPSDIALLAEHFLTLLGQEMPRKRLSEAALFKLQTHSWPGNVRELAPVLERGAILAAERPEIGAAEIRFRGKAQPLAASAARFVADAAA